MYIHRLIIAAKCLASQPVYRIKKFLSMLGRAQDSKVTMVKNRRWAVMVRITTNQLAWRKAMATIGKLREPREGIFRGIH